MSHVDQGNDRRKRCVGYLKRFLECLKNCGSDNATQAELFQILAATTRQARSPVAYKTSISCNRVTEISKGWGLFDTRPVWVVKGTWGRDIGHSITRPWGPTISPLTHMVYLGLFLSYLDGSKAFPPVQPGYDDKYCSRSYRFVEQQKLTCQ